MITPVVIADFVTDLGAQREPEALEVPEHKKCYFGRDSWIIAGSGNEHTGKIAGYTNRRAEEKAARPKDAPPCRLELF